MQPPIELAPSWAKYLVIQKNGGCWWFQFRPEFVNGKYVSHGMKKKQPHYWSPVKTASVECIRDDD